MSIRLVLASASPARLTTLRSAGIEPDIAVSQVDEVALLARAAADGTAPTAAEQVLLLAQAKARAVAAGLDDAASLVLGCDSMLELDGTVYGKPRDAAQATTRWRAMRGRSAVLHTGHWLIDRRSRPGAAGTESRAGANDGHRTETGASSATAVHFASLSDAEITAYVATGEPLVVAGAFTIDGFGGPFITGIEGDPHGVVGLSLPLLRELLAQLDVSIVDLWQR